MTLVIALSCKDGIVMASDGQATVISSGGPVRVEAEKIFEINDNTLFGASGDVGTIQKSLELIKGIPELRKDLTTSIKSVVKDKLSDLYKQEIDPIVKFHQALKTPQPPRPPIADILIAKIQEDNSRIIWHITPDCRDEALEHQGYACTGNGDIFAHTLLKGFDIKSLTTEGGKLLAYNTIKLAIETGAYGLGEPIDIWTITKRKEEVEVHRLSKEEMMALKDAWITWKETEKELFKKIALKELEQS